MAEKKLEIAVIGAGGPAGLITLKTLTEAGFKNILGFEASDRIGGTFARDWLPEHFRLQTPKNASRLFGDAFPKDCPVYPGKADINRYLYAGAKRYGLLPYINFNEKILQCYYRGGEYPWVIQSNLEHYRAKRIIISNGRYTLPSMPALKPGEAHFPQTDRLHSAAYHKLGDIKGKRLLFVGFGNSAETLIKDAVARGAEVVVSQRSAVTVNPGFLLRYRGNGCMPVFFLGNALRPLCEYGGRFGRLIADGLSHLVNRFYYPDLERFGFHRDKRGVFSKNHASKQSWIPVVEEGVIDLFRQGKIAPALPEIKQFHANKIIEFVNGEKQAVDKVIYCTGFMPNLNFLPYNIQQQVCVDGLPERSAQAYCDNSLYFIGMHYDLFGGLGRTLPLNAKKIVKHIKKHQLLANDHRICQNNQGLRKTILGNILPKAF